MTPRRYPLFRPAFLSVLLLALPARAAVPMEYQIKAVFLFNLTQFVTWPAASFSSPEEPFVIGILGQDPFGKFLDETVKGEKVDGHPLVVRRFQEASEVTACRILFIGRSEGGRPGRALSALKGKGILTVGDTEAFSEGGGMMRFLTQDNKIRFRVNLAAVQCEDLAFSSKLLRLAEVVGKKGGRPCD